MISLIFNQLTDPESDGLFSDSQPDMEVIQSDEARVTLDLFVFYVFKNINFSMFKVYQLGEMRIHAMDHSTYMRYVVKCVR